MYLLINSCILIGSIFIDGWIMQIIHLLLAGLQALIVL